MGRVGQYGPLVYWFMKGGDLTMEQDIDLGYTLKVFIASLLSRKFLSAIVLSILAYFQAIDGGITAQEMLVIAAPILTWLGFEGAADVVERKQVNTVEVKHSEKVETVPENK